MCIRSASRTNGILSWLCHVNVSTRITAIPCNYGERAAEIFHTIILTWQLNLPCTKVRMEPQRIRTHPDTLIAIYLAEIDVAAGRVTEYGNRAHLLILRAYIYFSFYFCACILINFRRTLRIKCLASRYLFYFWRHVIHCRDQLSLI